MVFRNHFVLFFLSNLLAFNLDAQEHQTIPSKKIQIIAFVHSGVSIFKVRNISKSPLYGTYEMHLGADLVKPLNDLVKVGLGLHFGIKTKRNSYYYGPSGMYTKEPAVIPSLDKAASQNTHLVTELRAVAQVQPRGTRTAIKGGLAARFWGPNNDNVNILSSRSELGVITGILYKTTPRFGLGLEWYASLKDFYYGTIGGPGTYSSFNVKNQYFMLTAEYRLK